MPPRRGNVRVSITSDFDGRGVARAETALGRLGTRSEHAGRTLTRGLTVPLLAVGGAAGKAAVDFESAFAGVRKTVDATEPQLAKLSDGIRDMARELPVAATELAGIAEAAGQLGIKRKSILDFTRTIADLGVSTNLAGEEGAAMLARFANITQMPQGEFDRLGSTIVALGNAGASTEAEIAAMALRIAGAGEQIGLSEHQILGFANALSSVGIEAEAGGSAISRTFVTMAQAVNAGGAELDSFAKVAGVSSDEFKRRFQQDAAGAAVSFIEGLARIKKEGGDVFAVLEDLGLSENRVRDALLRASGAGDLFSESLKTGAKAWKDNNALTKEAEQRYETTASQLQILKNNVTDIGITIGSELLPPLADLAGDGAGAVRELSDAFSELEPTQKRTIGILAGSAAALGPALFMFGKLSRAASLLTGTVGFTGLIGLAAAATLLATNSEQLLPPLRSAADTLTGLSGPLVPLIGDVARLALGFVDSKIGAAALSVVVGGLTGRMVGLGVAFAVGKIVAFSGSLRELARTMVLVAGTSLIQLRTGLIGAGASLGALAGPIGLIVGGLAGLGLALFGFKQGNDQARISADQLTDSLRRQEDAARAVRDLDLDLAQRKAAVRTANVSVERAERALSDARRQYGRNSLEAKEAESQLEQARIQQRRAQRDLNDAEKDGTRTRQDYAAATEKALNDNRNFEQQITELQDELDSENKKLEKAERLHGENSSAAKVHRDRIAELRAEITQLKNKRVKVEVDVGFLGIAGAGVGAAAGGAGADEGDGWGLSRAIDAKVKELTKEKAKRGELTPDVEGTGLNAFNAIARMFGVSIGSGVRPGARTRSGNQSYHALGRARDFPGPPSAMLAFAKYLAAAFGSRLKELIYTPLGFSIKNGRRVAPYAQADHHDHVHVAMRRGGKIEPQRLTVPTVLAAEAAPRWPEFYIPTEPRFRDRAIGLLAQAAEDLGLPGFRRGGVSGGMGRAATSARKAGFKGTALKLALAIAAAESANFTDMTGDEDLGGSYGPWMIHHPSHPQYDTGRLQRDWDYAADAAYKVSKGGRDWSPWTEFRNGGFRRFLDQARAAAIASAGSGGGGGVAGGDTGDGRRSGGIVTDAPRSGGGGVEDTRFDEPLPDEPAFGSPLGAGGGLHKGAGKSGLSGPKGRGTIGQRDMARAALDAKIQTGSGQLGAASALAALTADLGDDQVVAKQAVTFWQGILDQATATGNADLIAQAARELKTATDNLTQLTPTAKDFASRDLALAQLTDTLDDDRAALKELERLAAAELDAALQTADPRDDIEAANTLRGVRDSIKSLDQTLQQNSQRLEEQNRLLEEQVRNQALTIETMSRQQGAMLGWLASAISGITGRTAGQGMSSVGVPGRLATGVRGLG